MAIVSKFSIIVNFTIKRCSEIYQRRRKLKKKKKNLCWNVYFFYQNMGAEGRDFIFAILKCYIKIEFNKKKILAQGFGWRY